MVRKYLPHERLMMPLKKACRGHIIPPAVGGIGHYSFQNVQHCDVTGGRVHLDV